jgi:hypothetical protein
MLQKMPWNAHHKALALLCGGLYALASAWAQEPEQDASQMSHLQPRNLRVLPKDITGAEIGRLMKQFREDLGVACSYCHVENPQTQKLDYASDENPTKQTARLMIAMQNDINSKYLAQLGDRRYAVPVSCGSCHQGQSNPPPFEAR